MRKITPLQDFRIIPLGDYLPRLAQTFEQYPEIVGSISMAPMRAGSRVLYPMSILRYSSS